MAVVHAIEAFHELHPETAVEVNVTRHPYSFLGDSRTSGGGLPGADAPLSQTWHDALLGYMNNDPRARDMAEASMREQARAAGIELDYGVLAQWQPVSSQRLLLWAGRFGLQEEFMSALNKRHFERRQSASERDTLLAAAADVGLDAAAAAAFLDTEELTDEVWASYGRTITEKRIHSIPLFAMSVPSIDAWGGPFRPAGKHEAYVVRGSMDQGFFLGLLELILRDVKAGKRMYDAQAAPFRNDEWWRAPRADAGGNDGGARAGVCTR